MTTATTITSEAIAEARAEAVTAARLAVEDLVTNGYATYRWYGQAVGAAQAPAILLGADRDLYEASIWNEAAESMRRGAALARQYGWDTADLYEAAALEADRYEAIRYAAGTAS